MHTQRFRTPALLLATLAFVGACDRLPSESDITPGGVRADGAAAQDGAIDDARGYAAEYGVSVGEAARRIQLQEAIGELNARLAEEQAATFAGLTVEHAPEFHVVARFTRGGEETIRPYLADPALAGLVRVERARHSLQQLEGRLEASYRRVVATGIPAAGGLDVRANRAEVHVQRGALAAARAVLGGAGDAVVIEVDHLPAEELTLYGGLPLSTCTSGFTVRNSSNRRGISTSGHCGNSQSYSGNALTFIAERYSGSYDIQWHERSGATYRNIIKVGSNTRSITGTRSRSNQVVGERVCKQGKTTGYTCGTISSTSYCASGVCTWIRVAGGSVNLSEGGDSGGPWFYGNTAYGSHTYGIGNDSAYMASNYFAGLSVTIVTS
jgi:hypothetical protein